MIESIRKNLNHKKIIIISFIIIIAICCLCFSIVFFNKEKSFTIEILNCDISDFKEIPVEKYPSKPPAKINIPIPPDPVSKEKQMSEKIQPLLLSFPNLLKKNDYDNALKTLNKIIEIDPTHKNYSKHNEMLQKQKSKHEEIKKIFKYGIKLFKKKKNKLALDTFQKIHLMKKNMKKKYQFDEFEKAEAYIIKTKDKMVRLKYIKATKYYHQKKYKKAITEFNKIRSIHPGYKKTQEMYESIILNFENEAKKMYETACVYEGLDIEIAYQKWNKIIKKYSFVPSLNYYQKTKAKLIDYK